MVLKEPLLCLVKAIASSTAGTTWLVPMVSSKPQPPTKSVSNVSLRSLCLNKSHFKRNRIQTVKVYNRVFLKRALFCLIKPRTSSTAGTTWLASTVSPTSPNPEKVSNHFSLRSLCLNKSHFKRKRIQTLKKL